MKIPPKPFRIFINTALLCGLGSTVKAYLRYLRYRKGGKRAFQPSYVGEREDVIRLISGHTGEIKRALDVGCSSGAFGLQLKKLYKAEVTGIELDPEMAKVASGRLDRVIPADLDALRLDGYFSPAYFDHIFCLDILEHLKDPWATLKTLTAYLKDDGYLVMCIPNIQHYSTLIDIFFRGYWPYRDRGIHDRTHLRFFTLKNIRELAGSAGLEIVRISRSYRIIESPNPVNMLSKLLLFPLIFRGLFTFQYLVIAKKDARSSGNDNL